MAQTHSGWARVRHVVAEDMGGQRQGRRGVLPWLSAALLLPAVVLLLSTQQPSPTPPGSFLAAKMAAVQDALARPAAHPPHSPHEGLVQAVAGTTKARALENVAAHAAAAPKPGSASPSPAPAGKLVAGKSSESIRDAANAAVKTHLGILAVTESAGEAVTASGETADAHAQAQVPAPKPTPNFAKEPSLKADIPQEEIDSLAKQFSATKLLTNSDGKDKVLVKMFMEVRRKPRNPHFR